MKDFSIDLINSAKGTRKEVKAYFKKHGIKKDKYDKLNKWNKGILEGTDVAFTHIYVSESGYGYEINEIIDDIILTLPRDWPKLKELIEGEHPLIKEAKERYKEGVTIQTRHKWNVYKIRHFLFKNGVVELHGSCSSDKEDVDKGFLEVYKDGKWAEIVDEEFKLHGYSMKQEGDFIKFGCKKFNRVDVENLWLTVFNWNNLGRNNQRITKLTLGEYEVTVDELEQIVKAIK